MHTTANASALGYAAFALALWMFSMISADWFDPSQAIGALSTAVVLGGSVMAIAGIFSFLQGHTLDTVLFLAFAGYWWIVFLHAHTTTAAHPLASAFQGWYAMVWAFLAFCLWLAARKGGTARMLFVAGLCLSLFAEALAQWIQLDALTVLSGYLGLVTAILGIYIAAAEMLNEIHGHTVLPLGETGRGTPPTR